MYYLGVDGGGSKTSFVLITQEGRIVERAVQGTCHYLQVGHDGFAEVISMGIHKACQKAGIDIADITYSFLGLSGYGENERDADLMHRAITDILPGGFSCSNDSEAGWAGATGCKPGINIVSGTGSIVFGVDENGDRARAGGWGGFCGDEGSAYWIARRLMGLFAKQSDGRVAKSVLYDLVKASLNLKQDFDIIALLTDNYKQRDKVASISKVAYEAAILGDSACLKIFSEAAYELSLCVAAIMQQLYFDDADTIGVFYTGGVFESGDIIIQPLTAELRGISPKIRLQKPLLKPDLGSAYYAWVIKNNRQDDTVLESLKEEGAK